MEYNLTYLYYLSSLIWLLPIIRQHKSKFAFFFLVFGLTDIVAYLVYFFIVPNMYLVYITANYIIFLHIIEKKYLKKRWYLFLLLYLMLALGWVLTDKWEYHSLLTSLTYFSLVFTFLHLFMLELLERRFSIFILIIITRLIILTFTYLFVGIIDPMVLKNYYYFSIFVEIFIGFFFVIFRADNERLSIRL
jgi:hypothetical protein